jgi:hypothetical protein
MEGSKTSIIDSPKGKFLPELSWNDIHEAGSYVEKETGDLYRIHEEDLRNREFPSLPSERTGSSHFVQISKSPSVTTREARLLTVENDLCPNF